MRITHRKFKIITPEDFQGEKDRIEMAARTAYKSEGKMSQFQNEFIQSLVKREHTSPLEFGEMMVWIQTDRGITHELVRHRVGFSYMQESTRYCNYSKDKFDNEITVIHPEGIASQEEYDAWIKGCQSSEEQYFEMLRAKAPPERARAVLPTCLKAEIMVKANFQAWRHLFRVRVLNKDAHPDMRATFKGLYQLCQRECPAVFDLGDYQE